jgi:UDP-4-amino-4,6-dideoxy-N-acetyl-beta-L-altrosamine transaminase
MQNSIPYGRQNITEEDIQEVVKALRSDFLTQGPKIAEFEVAFASYVGAKYAVAVSNGTAALHLCCMALNVEPGQKVITTPITFAASANCVKYCGGDVAFADIDPETYLIDMAKVKALLEASPKGTFTGIIPVDFAGRAVNLEALRNLANAHGLWIIEDACHAPGGFFTDSKGVPQNCGNGNFADLAIFSFHPVKHIASGEGGMITTNDKALYTRLLTLRTHGITKNSDDFQNDLALAVGETYNTQPITNNYPGWYMEMQELGYNYRITDFQAALGLSQLSRADEGIAKRREMAAKYFEAFKSESGILGQSGTVSGHAYHLYIIEVEDRLGLYNHLRAHNIYAQIHYFPVHLMPYYRQQGFAPGDYPLAEKYYAHCISLPMYPTLTEAEHDFVIEKVITFLHG